MSLRGAEVLRPASCRRGKPERAAQREILLWLKNYGALTAVTDAGAAYRAGAFFGDAIPPGWPDITALLPDGRFCGIEVKAPRGRQSEAQKRMEHQIRQRHGIYILARRVDDVRRRIGESE